MSDRSQIARIAALTRASMTDGREMTAAAVRANERRWLDLVDPARTLPEGERQRRAEAAKKAHFARLALKSAQARRRKAGAA